MQTKKISRFTHFFSVEKMVGSVILLPIVSLNVLGGASAEIHLSGLVISDWQQFSDLPSSASLLLLLLLVYLRYNLHIVRYTNLKCTIQ